MEDGDFPLQGRPDQPLQALEHSFPSGHWSVIFHKFQSGEQAERLSPHHSFIHFKQRKP